MNTESQFAVPVHPVHKIPDSYSPGRKYQGPLGLFITKPNKPESRLATALPAQYQRAHNNGMEAAYDHLVQEKTKWMQNGDPVFLISSYRIGASTTGKNE